MVKKKMQRMTPQALNAFVQGARQQKLRAAQARALPEKDLWQKWHNGGRQQQDLIPLMKSLENVVRAEARKFAKGYGGALVEGANEVELRRCLLKAIQTYNPNSGVKISTWAVTKMRDFTGTAAKRRNFGRMSKTDFRSFQTFNNAINELRMEGARHPTVTQIAEGVGWPAGRVKRMQKNIRRELFTGITPGQDDDVSSSPSQMRSVMSLMYFNNDEERRVFQALKLHAPDAAVTRPFDMKMIAKQLNIPESRLYKIRETLRRRVDPILKRL